MSYNQLIPPDRSTKGTVGECLNFAERAVGAPQIFRNATVAANNTQFRHLDQNFPEGVDVVIWFSFWTTINGIFADYGHVCFRLSDGRIFSSPYKQGTGQAYLNSIQELQRLYTDGQHPLVYRFWTEDIATIRVVEEETYMPFLNDGDVINLIRSIHQDPNFPVPQSELDYYKASDDHAKDLMYKNMGELQRLIDKSGNPAYKNVGNINGVTMYQKES